MTSRPDRSEETIFADALALPATERAAFVRSACGGDERLQKAVEALLQAHASAGDFLPSRVESSAAVTVLRVEEKPGDHIGRYKLLQQIGEGGCGVVYMAEQEEPVRRRVALKVIKLGMDTKAVVARFEAERQALAMMDHPNIAKVFDAGATEAGRPFFVMELVRGIPITKYCDEASLPMEQRLELFSQVCAAIQHAHQKGIIHRDIKPSNILVTLHDGVPVPKVIDFGIAKATHGRLTDQTMFTAFEQFIGTPSYMSPEQAEMSGLDIDTRSDIYSLGVLLYELLAGRPPFEPKAFMQAGLDEMRRMIREVEPPKPSRRLSTLTDIDRTTVAKLRGTAPAQLTTVLSGDLDWIVMRCLEKDRTRRYGTPTELAADVQRHLKNEPVTARPPSAFYLVGKLVRRHKLAVATTVAIAAALILGAGVATWQAVRATRAEQEARKEAKKSQRVAQFVTSVWGGAGAETLRGRDTSLLKELLDHAAKRLETELAEEPAAQAWLFGSLQVEYVFLNEMATSEAMARKRLALLTRLHPQGNEDTLDAMGGMVSVLVEQGKMAEAEKMAADALALFRSGVGAPPTMGIFLQRVQVDVAKAKRDYPRALALSREALAAHRLLPRSSADDNLALAITLDQVAEMERLFGRFAEGEKLFREALALRRKSGARDDPDLVKSLRSVAACAQLRGATPEAESLLHEALALVRARPDSNGKYGEMSLVVGSLSRLLLATGNTAEAERLCRVAQAEIAANCSPKLDTLGISHGQLAAVLRRKGDWDGAEAELRAEHAFWVERYGAESSAAAGTLLRLSQVLQDAANLDQAEEVARAGLAALRKSPADRVMLIGPLQTLAKIQSARGNHGAAEASAQEAMAFARQNLPVAEKTIPAILSTLATIALNRGDHAGAERLLLEAVQKEEQQTSLRLEVRRSLYEAAVKLYTSWSKSDAAKLEAVRRWQLKLDGTKAAGDSL